MAYEIRVPRLGWSMEEGRFVGWLAQPGARVGPGQPLFELESEKAVEPVEAIDEGILHIPIGAPEPGSTVLVGALLGYLLEAGEPAPDLPSGVIEPPAEAIPPGERAETEPVPHRSRGRIATPRARRVARELGVDWTRLGGSGRGGRVREADIRTAQREVPRAQPLAPRRRAIAERLRASRERTVPVTLTTLADVGELVARREAHKAEGGIVPAYTDLIGCIVARVLTRHLALASRWDDAHDSLIPASPEAIHIGIAVDTPAGLLVPVVRDLARRSSTAVAAESTRLIERAREGRLSSSEMQGGVFTITNLGGFGIDAFTPVLNPPEVAILGLGAIRLEPVVMPSGWIEPRHRMTLSLTFDHAALDGAPAAAFLRDVATALGSPGSTQEIGVSSHKIGVRSHSR